MKTLFAILALGFVCTTTVFAWRSLPPPTTAQLVASSPWIFAGRVLRYEASTAGSPIGTAYVKLTILAGLPLRGSPPKTVTISGLRDRPFDFSVKPGAVLIFFAGPLDTGSPGIDGTFRDVRPFSDLGSVQVLVRQADSTQ